MTTVADVAALCDRLWPPDWAESWDNVGLLAGAPGGPADRCMWALDADPAAVDEAADAGCGLLLTHHPVPFRPLRRVIADDPAGAVVLLAARRGVALYAAHTNLDVAPEGTGHCLGQALGLRSAGLLQTTSRDPLYKLVTFVPAGHADAVRDALAAAGAGQLGRYSHCSFGTAGTGTFRALPGANPFVGEVGVLHREPEVRLEMLVPEPVRAAAVAALLRAHPYEEVAYDVIRLGNDGPARGYGVVGDLRRAVPLSAYAAAVARRLEAPATRYAGPPGRDVRRVAACGGAGAGCVPAALAAGADVLVTADVRYHEARDAEAAGLALVDPGHQATEWPVVPGAAAALRRSAEAAGVALEVLVARRRGDVWNAPRRG